MTWIRRGASAAVAAGVFGVVASLPAHAAPEMYAESDYRAQIGWFTSPMTTHRNVSLKNNDTLTSFRNNTPYSAAFWHDANRGGRCFTAAPGDYNAKLGFWDNEKISSFQLGRGC